MVGGKSHIACRRHRAGRRTSHKREVPGTDRGALIDPVDRILLQQLLNLKRVETMAVAYLCEHSA